jgi:hypothetical protein
MNKNFSFSILAIAFLVLMAGCNQAEPVRISDLYVHTTEYQDKKITVKGEVGVSIALLGLSGFVLNDGTGDLIVVGYTPTPSPGDEITVRGELSVPYRWQDDILLVLKIKAKGKKKKKRSISQNFW